MKVRLFNKTVRKTLAQLQADHPEGLPSITGLKRQVSLIDFLSFHLEQDPERTDDDNKAMFYCWRHEYRKKNGGHTPSLWCYDDYQGTGIGRWGCPTCCSRGDDVYGFLQQLHSDSMAEAVKKVQRWVRDRRLRGSR